jgi:hypothetical protein
VAPPPPDGSRGCVATIRRLMQGVGHTVPCGTSRQALCDTLVSVSLGECWEPPPEVIQDITKIFNKILRGAP